MDMIEFIPATIPEFFSYLQGQFFRNDFLQAAIVGAPLAALSWTFRSFPGKVWEWIKFATTVEIIFNNDIPDYNLIASFISEEVVDTRFSRKFSYQEDQKWSHEKDEMIACNEGIAIGYGKHFGTWDRRFVFIERFLEEGQQTEKFKERIKLTVATRSQTRLASLTDQIRKRIAKGGEESHIPVFINSGDRWKRGTKLPLRSLSTIFTSGGQAERLLKHIVNFEQSKSECRRKGIPWHTGVLLHGKPGTGKTSLIHAVASETGRSITYLALGAVDNDKILVNLISTPRDWEKTILVIEDADATGVSVKRAQENKKDADEEESKPVTLSAMLNILDGLITPDGLVVIATTNHPERLDPALVRPGRFDLNLDLGDLEFEEFADMAKLLVDASDEEIERARPTYRPDTGASFRAQLNEGGVDAVILNNIRRY